MAGGLHKKLLAIMGEVGRIPKNGVNSFHKYNYVLESDLVDAIRKLLVKHGVAFYGSVLEQSRSEEFTKVSMRFTFADTESDETLALDFWGEGQDKGDKGLYKAYTGAEKYCLMKTFLIPTGVDPDDNQTGKGKKPDPPSPMMAGSLADAVETVYMVAGDKSVAKADVVLLATQAVGRKVEKLEDLSKEELSEFAERLHRAPKKVLEDTITRIKARQS